MFYMYIRGINAAVSESTAVFFLFHLQNTSIYLGITFHENLNCV